ncbi:MAG: EAL domain-containing protein, partial [Magnetococcales bacterium]|nr:EAL domain-containing protein [Magnetococcales bacterium]
QDGEERETLLKHADIAMYSAKEAGKGTYRFYTDEMNAWTKHRLALEAELQKALEREEFRVFYQPKIDCTGERVVGMEALVRWQHPENGMVNPGEFISLAEETGLIQPIGEWVFLEACRQTKRWHEAGFEHLKIAINLSPRQFQKEGLVERIDALAKQSGLATDYIELEVTESMMMDNVEQAIATLSRIRALGIHLAMDDFGTGYSSLSVLKRFPIQTLKIDRSFVQHVTEDSDDEAIVSAIISMAESLDLKLVAEGVETDAQEAFLLERSCCLIQGFKYAPPLSNEAFEEYLRTFSPSTDQPER